MKKILKVFIAFFIIFINFGCNTKNIENRILYSWHMKSIGDKKLVETIKKLNINILYQDFSKEYLEDPFDNFLKEMYELDVKVYHLSGDPTWGIKGSNKIKKEIDKIINYNKNNKYKISGIVLDIESYTLNQFDMDEYIKIIEKSYKYAKDNNIYLVLCIPTWYKKEYLDKLIPNTDEISIMNYNINKTVTDIKEEIKISKKYNKKINTIYEINFNSKKYFSSYDKIEKNYKKIQNSYDYPISIAYHHYDSIICVDKNNK